MFMPLDKASRYVTSHPGRLGLAIPSRRETTSSGTGQEAASSARNI